MTPVNFSELLMAFEFASADGGGESRAYVDRETGAIHWVAEDGALDDADELPEDLEDSPRYVRVPDRKTLDLGQELVFAFVTQHLPEEEGTVAAYFRRRGAYRQFRDLLGRRGLLDAWHTFQDEASARALREWCREEGLEPVGD